MGWIKRSVRSHNHSRRLLDITRSTWHSSAFPLCSKLQLERVDFSETTGRFVKGSPDCHEPSRAKRVITVGPLSGLRGAAGANDRKRGPSCAGVMICAMPVAVQPKADSAAMGHSY